MLYSTFASAYHKKGDNSIVVETLIFYRVRQKLLLTLLLSKYSNIKYNEIVCVN